MPANHKFKILPLILLLVACSGVAVAQQTTAFTYQGSLSPAGTYNLRFDLFASSGGGAPIGTQTFTNVNVSGGTFTVVLDFGASAFPGADRWLETTVNSTTLSPRIQITSVPYAIRALNVGPVAGSDPTAMVSVTNTQAGVTSPSFPANVPPAAIRGEVTSSVNTSAGLIGISAGSFGLGIAGISTGTPGANDNPAGVFGQALGTSGKTRGVVGSIRSPNGIAVQALSTGGNLFVGSSGPQGSEVDKFSVDANGNVITNGNVNAASVSATGNVSATGDVNASGNVIASGALRVVPAGSGPVFEVDASGHLVTTGSIELAQPGFGTRTFIVSAAGNVHNLGTLQTDGDAVFNGTIKANFPAGGTATLCSNPSSGIISSCSSSVRYKKNILSLGAGLDVVRRLRPITFRWKEGGQPDLGLIAEEVNSVEPLLVTRNVKGEIEGVKYDRLSAVFINAFKEQQAQIQKQQQEIELQRTQIQNLKRLMCRSHRRASICKR
jgi:hypothetical protein